MNTIVVAVTYTALIHYEEEEKEEQEEEDERKWRRRNAVLRELVPWGMPLQSTHSLLPPQTLNESRR